MSTISDWRLEPWAGTLPAIWDTGTGHGLRLCHRPDRLSRCGNGAATG